MKFWRNKKIVFGVLAIMIFMVGQIEFVYAVDTGTVIGATATGAVAGALIATPFGMTPVGAIVGGIVGLAKSLSGKFVNIVSTGAILLAVNIFSYILGFIASAVFSVGGFLVDFALEINFHLLGSSIIQTGWGIVLSFTNLGFVLAIIVIAFATIFRIQSYAMKQVLWKLIVAALLVNFSLVIAGAFINIADNVTSSFNNKILGASGVGLSTKLAGVLNTQFFLSGENYLETIEKGKNATTTTNTPIITGAGLTGTDAASMALKGIVTLLFIAFFTFLSALTLLAIAIMLVIRYVYLVILLILSPVVWLLWIFPGTDKYWKEWWDNFLRWVFFAPIVLFFLYLTISTIDKFPGEMAKQATSKMSQYPNGPFAIDLAYIGDLVAILGLLIGGLLVANKLGITGAKVAMGAAEGAAKGMGKGIARLPLRGGAAVLKGTGLGNRLNNTATNWQASPNRFTRFAGRRLSGIAGGIQKGAAYKGKGVGASIWGGMKSGSGLFKNKKQQLLEEVIREEKEIEKKKGKKKEEEKEPKPKEEKKT